ncbi:hypothetical protein EC957_002122 [Mortierella hygrophila]|uniref:INO80 complex subunit E N-terminal domain-containing protein n=1 Tax=Mortierella hygrophila TaxID=979708 RepID=A0A9P6F5N9_9FUNG|nr:hypothetical protein EC957_002122 [Mortierella hygrophila]
MVPSNSDIEMAPTSPVLERTSESTSIKDKDTTMRPEEGQQQKQQDEVDKDDNMAAKGSLQAEGEDASLSAAEDKKEPLKTEGDSHYKLKMDTDDGTDADTTNHATSLTNGISTAGQYPVEKTVEKKPRKHAERESKRGQKSSKANGHHPVEEEEHEMEHQARHHPSDEKYRRLKRKLKEVLEENERLGIELDRSNRRARNLRREKNILLDKISTYERESDSSPDTLSSMSSDSDLSDSSLHSHFRSRRATPTKAPAPTTSNNKHLRVPAAKETNSSSPVAHHPKKTAGKVGGRRSPAVTGRKDHKEPGPASTPSTITNVGSATQKPKRIHNSSKLKPNSNKIRKVQVLEKNEDGSIKFPVTIGIITIMKIGHVVSDREAFHNERYIWPVGYTMSRSYNSMVNPNEQTVYTCSVIDDGEAPKFQIDAEDQPSKPIIAGTATGAWTHVVKTANAIRKRDHSNSASGPDYFGFSNATIAKMIQDLPHADECKSYVMQRFEEPSVKPPSTTPEKRKSSNLGSSKGGKGGEGEQGDNEEDEEEEEEDEYTSLGTPKKKKAKRAASPKILQAGTEANSADKSRAASDDEMQERHEPEEAEADAEADAEAEEEEEGDEEEDGDDDEQEGVDVLDGDETLSEKDTADEDVDIDDDDDDEDDEDSAVAPSASTAAAAASTATNPPIVITIAEEASESEDAVKADTTENATSIAP